MKYFAQIPRNIADLEVLGPEMAEGLTKLAQALGITQITSTQMTAATDALVQADDIFNASRSAQQTAYNNFPPADEALTTWLGKATAAFSTFFGERWNRQWVQAGFVSPSIAIPTTITERVALALRVINFLLANPGKEAPTLGVTAAAGTVLRDSAINLQNLTITADQDVENKGSARQTAVNALTSKMRLLIGILAELLNSDDTRWLDFGLEIPSKLTTPAAPTGLAAAASPANEAARAADPNTMNVLLTCDAAPFATRYRFRMRVVGLLGSNYQLVASSTEPLAQVAVPANATVEFIAQAVNGNRQSVASEPAVYSPVAVESPAPATVPGPALEMPASAQTNGSSGHVNGSRSPARIA